MEITKVSETEPSKNPHKVDARPIYSHENAQVIVLTLKPGEQLKRHITPVDVFFYVLEGKGIIEIGDEKKEATKDTIIHSPKKVVHCWYNKSNNPLKILVAKTPKPQNQQYYCKSHFLQFTKDNSTTTPIRSQIAEDC